MSNVRITTEIHRENDMRMLTFNGEALKVSIDLWKCDTCAALTLREERLTHEVFHDTIATVVELLQNRTS
jgi:hypothetical protein